MPANSIKRPTRRVMPVLPPDEARRLATLYFLDILDSPPQEQFDRIARMAQRLFTVPMAAISFVDAPDSMKTVAVGCAGAFAGCD